MGILRGIQNFLEFINNNWTVIIIIIGLILMLIKKIQSYLSMTTDEKISVAKTQLQETILKLISNAEFDYEEWTKAGSIKRSQVIEQIFKDYPILSKVTNQKDLINWIDKLIDTALEDLRKIIKENADNETSSVN